MKKLPKGFKFNGKIELPRPSLKEKPKGSAAAKAANAAISRGVIKGMAAVEGSLKVALDAALESSVWTGFNPKHPYPRKNGEMMGSGPRNIVDTGRLKNSLKLKSSFAQTKSSLTIGYSVPYAGLVHNGGVILPYGNANAQPVLLPARPWISAVLNGTHGQQKFQAKGYFAEAVAEEWNGSIG